MASAPLMSVSSLSPTTRGRRAPVASAAASNIGRAGFPMTTGVTPVVAATAATSAPAPGHNPSGAGSDGSALVATSRAPRSTRSDAVRSFP